MATILRELCADGVIVVQSGEYLHTLQEGRAGHGQALMDADAVPKMPGVRALHLSPALAGLVAGSSNLAVVQRHISGLDAAIRQGMVEIPPSSIASGLTYASARARANALQIAVRVADPSLGRDGDPLVQVFDVHGRPTTADNAAFVHMLPDPTATPSAPLDERAILGAEPMSARWKVRDSGDVQTAGRVHYLGSLAGGKASWPALERAAADVDADVPIIALNAPGTKALPAADMLGVLESLLIQYQVWLRNPPIVVAEGAVDERVMRLVGRYGASVVYRSAPERAGRGFAGLESPRWRVRLPDGTDSELFGEWLPGAALLAAAAGRSRAVQGQRPPQLLLDGLSTDATRVAKSPQAFADWMSVVVAQDHRATVTRMAGLDPKNAMFAVPDAVGRLADADQTEVALKILGADSGHGALLGEALLGKGASAGALAGLARGVDVA
jgi:hypothetical protein